MIVFCLLQGGRLVKMFILSTRNIRFGEGLVSIVVVSHFPSRSMFCLLKRGVSSRRFLSTQTMRFGGK